MYREWKHGHDLLERACSSKIPKDFCGPAVEVQLLVAVATGVTILRSAGKEGVEEKRCRSRVLDPYHRLIAAIAAQERVKDAELLLHEVPHIAGPCTLQLYWCNNLQAMDSCEKTTEA